MKPNGEPMSHSATRAPTIPYGMAAKTMSGFIAFRNCSTRARKMQETEIEHHDGQIVEALVLLFFLAGDLELVSGWQLALELRERRTRAASHLGRQARRGGERRNRDRAELVAPLDLLQLHVVGDARDLAQRHLLRALRARTRKDFGDRSVARAPPSAAARPRGSACRLRAASRPCSPFMTESRGQRDVVVGDAGQVRPIRIDVEVDHEALHAPVVVDPLGDGNRRVDLLQPTGRASATSPDVVAREADRRPECRRAGPSPAGGRRNGRPAVRAERPLQLLDQMRRVVLVVDLDDDLCVVRLLRLGRQR